MRKIKILSASYKLDKDNKYGIINGNLWQQESFSEYDVLVVDPISMHIFDNLTNRDTVKIYVQRRPEELKILLERTGGIVICFLREKRSNRYVWLPSRYYTESEMNTEIRKRMKKKLEAAYTEGGSGGGGVINPLLLVLGLLPLMMRRRKH